MNSKLPYAAWFAIFAVIIATTFGPITIRVAQLEGVPSIYIITARLLLTSLVLAPIALRRRDATKLWQMGRQDWLWAGLAGFFLAVNLLMLFLALEYTSVLVTGILRRLTPIWAIGLEMFFLAAIFSRRVWLGVLVTIAGSIAVALGSAGAVEAGSAPAFGALLAIIGSVCMGFYLLIGRKLRDVLPSLTYSWLVFTIAVLSNRLFLGAGGHNRLPNIGPYRPQHDAAIFTRDPYEPDYANLHCSQWCRRIFCLQPDPFVLADSR